MNTISSVSPHTASLTGTEYIAYLLRHAVENQYAVAVWRLPNDSVCHLILSRKLQRLSQDAALEELATGFLFAPFQKSRERIFLPADFKFTFTGDNLQPAATPAEIQSHTWLQEQLKQVPYTPHTPTCYTVPPTGQETETSYAELVRMAVAEIEKGSFEKVVPSRRKIVDLPEGFDVVQAFQTLSNAYPHALVSFVSTPETGSWLGATPETLAHVHDNTLFKTVALAGTQRFVPGIDLRTVAWTQKEIEEQALVERYVISCFKKIRVREYDEYGPKTVVAGNLLHLRSDFTVNMKEINFSQLGSVMLQLLHPTSAVCGMPLEPASAFLQQYEGYDREFYAGFLGPVNVGNDIHIFVNLRCLKLHDGKATLYAGAGVTVDSTPENEVAETEIKFQTLRKPLFDQPV
ncbi:chorismate-binding protein [Parachryseolinea silvisoli]|uniref:chorismate-binding protein n=1 Tax=Parachryseolinea silvisoli TaxID=2873601 RepID=UPI002265AB68|nr:chorismate-binding protein [Parachryseolinea silvisoli]MCD9019809.1 chorismate-binding protein [Parachryseolinea silvisoli]